MTIAVDLGRKATKQTKAVQSNQCICYLLSANYDVSSQVHIHNFKILASLCSLTGWFEHYLVGNSKDRFSCDEAHLIIEREISNNVAV